MSNNTFWKVLNDLNGLKFDGWWVNNWYEWLVLVAFSLVFVFFLFIVLRYFSIAGRPVDAKKQVLLNLMGLVIFLSLLLILPSFLTKFFPSFSLVISGLAGVQDLQKLTHDDWNDIVNVFRWLGWMGTIGVVTAFAVIVPQQCRAILLRDITIQKEGYQKTSGGAYMPTPPPAGPTPLPSVLRPRPKYSETPAYPSPQVSVELGELTPLPSKNYSPDDITPPPQELTPLPREPLPVAAWLQAISYSNSNEEIFELDTVETRIGREIGDIILRKDRSISRDHGMIKYDAGDFYYSDNSRRKSSWINDRQLKNNEIVHLKDNDKLRMGESIFHFHIVEWPELKMLSGPMKNKTLKGRRTPITIGTGDANHVRVVEEDGVLDVHGKIELDRHTKRFILDPVSEDHILINEKRPKGDPPWPLSDGYKVKIGRNSFEISVKPPSK